MHAPLVLLCLCACISLSLCYTPDTFEVTVGEYSGTLQPDGLDRNALFGSSVSTSSQWMVVGAESDGEDGEVYIYQRVQSEWALHTTLHKDPVSDFSDFGAAVSVAEWVPDYYLPRPLGGWKACG
ncbi:hypothetical protein KIPB_009026 [Kipferlia bialata]|uniref:DOMON domain-containing protein n=1 Tax=Kipferlia bialata TaxID=797122 RepID=A0A9K3GKB1_9EUKA|nr:hypothetical protein KIPB_009026 [Kipferlia bialata]|eukprot:g9026.t1